MTPRMGSRAALLVGVLIVGAVTFGAPIAAAAQSGRVALIYNGASGARGGPEAVATVARNLGLQVEFISDLSLLPEKLKSAAVFVVGGTDDNLTPLLRSFTPEVIAAVKDYLQRGGRYWGICGGGYIASMGWEEKAGFQRALGLVDAKSVAWVERAESRIVTVTWLGEKRTMYYQYGPAFEAPLGADARVLANYEDGRVAAFVVSSGKGKVALCGPHPEADETWLSDTPPPVDASSWKPTIQLATAMLRELLAD
jgi:glutamine amidotransferase-like uncharacterized protein